MQARALSASPHSSVAPVEQAAQQPVLLLAHLAHAAHHARLAARRRSTSVCEASISAGLERLGHHLGRAGGGEPLDVGFVARAHDHRHARD